MLSSLGNILHEYHVVSISTSSVFKILFYLHFNHCTAYTVCFHCLHVRLLRVILNTDQSIISPIRCGEGVTSSVRVHNHLNNNKNSPILVSAACSMTTKHQYQQSNCNCSTTGISVSTLQHRHSSRALRRHRCWAGSDRARVFDGHSLRRPCLALQRLFPYMTTDFTRRIIPHIAP